jgi:2-amino-4-hydroxy-6-hydroxymethyldihydropteridine diphosphokinase
MARAYVGLGANLGDATATIDAAIAGISHLPGTQLAGRSSLYVSAPVDAAGPDFFNAVAALDTDLQPLELLAALQALETAHGRARPYRNAPRTLDLDILLFGDTVEADPLLTLPHPRMTERAFVLLPLAEIAPGLCLPDGRSVAGLAQQVRDQRISRIIPDPPA